MESTTGQADGNGLERSQRDHLRYPWGDAGVCRGASSHRHRLPDATDWVARSRSTAITALTPMRGVAARSLKPGDRVARCTPSERSVDLRHPPGRTRSSARSHACVADGPRTRDGPDPTPTPSTDPTLRSWDVRLASLRWVAGRGGPRPDQADAPSGLAEGVGFEPTRLSPDGFQDRCLQPLGHPSRMESSRHCSGSMASTGHGPSHASCACGHVAERTKSGEVR